MKGRLGAYAAWQARDFALERGAPMLVVSALILLPLVVMMRAMRSQGPEGAEFAGTALSALAQSMPLLAFVLILIAVNGIASNDRTRGYYRFLFAKPVSLVRYYVQSFLVSGAGLLVVASILLVTFWMTAYPIFPAGAFLFLALYFVGLGGIGFLLSTVFRSDWIFLSGLWMLSTLLRGIFPAGESWYGRVFHVVFPPTHVVGDLAGALMHGVPVELGQVLWLGGYGAAAFILGLIVLRRRSLAS